MLWSLTSFSWLQSTILACRVLGFLPNALIADNTLPLTVSGLIVFLGQPGPPWWPGSSSVSQLFLAARLSLAAQFFLVVSASLSRPATYLMHQQVWEMRLEEESNE